MNDFFYKIKDILYLVIGSAVAGFSIACFTTPAKIVGGGVNGVAVMLYHVFGWDTGLSMFIVCIPLFIIGWIIFGKHYVLKSIIGLSLLSFWSSFFGHLTGYQGFLDNSNLIYVLMSAIFGGALTGGGIGLVLRTGANTGGTDIIAQIIAKYTPIPLGTALVMIDACVIIGGFFTFGFERALFGVVALFASGQAVNFMVMSIGTKYAKAAYIFSEKYESISKRLIKELRHGGTLITGSGIYSGANRVMLLAVVHNQQINHLQSIVKDEDPNAFMFVQETYEVLGQGFTPMKLAKKH